MQLPSAASAEARALAQALGVTVTMADLLVRRGLGDEASARRFLRPQLRDLTAPEAMIGRGEAAERLAHAVRRGERVAVFGDYDCDGITAAAIMTEGLRRLGGEVTPLLASRFAGGYGLCDEALDRILERRPRVLVTCDCGSADAPRVRRAREAGLDVIVIDHHLVPDEPLEAVAFLNPHRPECGFAYKGMASCGLAMSVIAAVRTQLKVDLDVRQFLDLVAIGTIADVAPLDGDNRAMVWAGLRTLQTAARPGIRALAAVAGLDLSRPLVARDVSFVLAPRLNAPGRLASPEAALSVLLARTEPDAQLAAAACQQANQDRRQLQDQIVLEADDDLGPLAGADAFVIARRGWHKGVVGIVAGRIADRHQRPVVVAAVDAEGVATGSVRTAQDINIHEALGHCRELLLGFGGHAKAAGVTFRIEHLGAFQKAFAAACAALREGAAVAPTVAPDVLLDPGDAPLRVVDDLRQLEPCGEGNRAPLLGLREARLRDVREMRGGHLRAIVEAAGRSIALFGPGLGRCLATLPSDRVHVAGHLERDTYNGGDALQVRATAIEAAR
ncbi:MAG: single-stranded-DNA-specific exonuclease RecJ [Myxococcales bacterium]|nr:MAG: single-stranded-DNA-specific exonuclease RecJ [Myxococcales bacterium]